MNLDVRSGAICKIIAALAFIGATQIWAQDSWVRHDPKKNHGVIVFVHGLMGDATTTWKSGNAYWPEMLTQDPAFAGQDIYVYRYPSPANRVTLSIDQIADNMRSVLNTDGVLQHDEITFVSHSMGGIVTRAFILKYRDVAPKIRLLFFFATPTTGTQYAQLAGILSRNPQFKQLSPMQADSYLATLQSNWLAADLRLKSYCAYEIQPLYGQIVVDMQSATNLCTQHLSPIDADHTTIAKPKDRNSASYVALKDAFMETSVPTKQPKKAPVTPAPKPSSPPPIQPLVAHECPLRSGENIYIYCSDTQVGQFAIDESAKMTTLTDEWKARIIQGTGSPEYFRIRFDEDFRDCCLTELRLLRAEVVARLGPASDLEESRQWGSLFPDIKYPGLRTEPVMIVSVIAYTPYLHNLGLLLKRRETPRSDTIKLAFESKDIPVGSIKGVSLPYQMQITLTAPRELTKGYIAVDVDPGAGFWGSDSYTAQIVMGDITNAALRAMYTQKPSLYLLKIVGNPFIPEVPIHVYAASGRPMKVVGAFWFDE